MNAKPVRNKKTGLKGWKYRYTTPTGKRTKITIYISERREADAAFQEHINGLQARAHGLPDHSGFQTPYKEIVKRFLTELVASEDRRKNLRWCLEMNLLGLKAGADLMNVAVVSAACVPLLKERKDVFIRHYVQQPIKQLAGWCAQVGLLPFNALTSWKLIPRTSIAPRRKALLPDEVNAILEAAADYDALFKRVSNTPLLIKVLLVTGNRPGVIFGANVGDLAHNRILLPESRGKKRNGMATLPLELINELKQSLAKRDDPSHDKPLLISHCGGRISAQNIKDDFRRSMILAFVRMAWPKNGALAKSVDPLQVAFRFYRKRLPKFYGPQPRTEPKRRVREQKAKDIEAVAQLIAPEVARRFERRDMYTLRSTHISWARQLVNSDSVKLQVGHAPQDIEERHYLDLVDARFSSQTVWDVLTGKKALRSTVSQVITLPKAAGAESQSVDPE